MQGVKMIRIVVIWLIFNTVAFGQDTQWILDKSARNFDQQHIRLELGFDFDQEMVFGTANLTFAPLQDNFRELVLHAQIDSVQAVRAGEDNLSFAQEDGLLRIQLNRPVSAGKSTEVSIRYKTRPTRGLYFFHATKDHPEIPDQIWSQGQGEDNRYWFPCYDKPDDKLTSEIIATVPDTLRVIANGELLEISENAARRQKTFHWKMDQPHVTYLISLVAGDYMTVSDTVRGVPLHYNLPADRANDNPDFPFGRTPEMLTFFSDYITPYPYAKYDQTPVQDFAYGGMENITATTLNRRIFHDQRARPNYSADGLVAHEFAHQWFGDLLTCDEWPHMWLNEGMATYFTDLYFEYQEGTDELRMRRLRQNRSYFASLQTQPIDSLQPSADGVTPVELGGGKAYTRGAAILHMLRFELDDAAFQKGIRRYVKKHKFGTVVSEDLRQAMEYDSGQDLSWFFKQWVYGAGFPVFDVAWSWDDTAHTLTLQVEQIQKESPAVDVFRMAVPMEITAGAQVLRKTLTIRYRKESFEFKLDRRPDMVRFDKGYWNLKKVDFEKSFAELCYQLQYDSDVTGRYLAAEQLAGHGDKAIPVLQRELIREPFYAVRTRVVESLGKMGSAKALAALELAAKDPDARVREAVMQQLAHFKAPEVTTVLKAHFRDENNDYVRSAALASLGEIQAPGTFELVQTALAMDSHRNVIRRGAFAALKALHDPRALPLVQQYTQYRYSYGGMHLLDVAALECAKALATDHRAAALDAIAGALRNPYFRTRIRAARLLAELGAVEKLAALNEVLQTDRRDRVRPALEQAIKTLADRKASKSSL